MQEESSLRIKYRQSYIRDRQPEPNRKGQILLQSLPFLHFCKKYDICIGDRLAFGCDILYGSRVFINRETVNVLYVSL